MEYKRTHQPQVRECDPDCRVGIRGYLNYFQDVAGGYMIELDKGNNVIPKKYGLSWIYTKYRLKILERVSFEEPVDFRCWVEKSDRLRCWQNLEVSRHGKTVCEGRLESCTYDMKARTLGRLSGIEWDASLNEGGANSVGSFTRLVPQLPEGAEQHQTYTVSFTDLDSSMHMNNLHYIDLFLNAFGPEYYEARPVMGLELHYMAQSYYGEKLTVYAKEEESGSTLLYAIKEDGTTSAVCRFEY